MKLQSNFQPGIPSKAVSTLLEILADLEELRRLLFPEEKFQPFLRFYLDELVSALEKIYLDEFQPFLRFYCRDANPKPCGEALVSTLLEILRDKTNLRPYVAEFWDWFQPFLRFWRCLSPPLWWRWSVSCFNPS